MAAQRLGIKATIVMGRNTPSIKVNAVRARGAKVILHGDSYDQASAHATDWQLLRVWFTCHLMTMLMS